MSINNEIMEEVKLVHKDMSANKIMGKFISWCVGIISACAIAMLMFIWQLKEEVPLLKRGYINMEGAINTLQNSVNNIQMKQQTATENQIRVEERLKNIESKIDKK